MNFSLVIKTSGLEQRKVLSSTWLIAKEAISKFCHQSNFPTTTFTMAELGCSCGPNALLIASNLVERVEEIRKRLQKNALEYQILLNDLHGNDFNAIFRSLPSFLEELKTKIGAHDSDFGPCFFNGVPGSFYFRLFPTNSVHFFHSTYTLHWLSRVSFCLSLFFLLSIYQYCFFINYTHLRPWPQLPLLMIILENIFTTHYMLGTFQVAMHVTKSLVCTFQKLDFKISRD